jgi:hypothetical protein
METERNLHHKLANYLTSAIAFLELGKPEKALEHAKEAARVSSKLFEMLNEREGLGTRETWRQKKR